MSSDTSVAATHGIPALSAADFEGKKLRRSGLWLADFTATWCPPCRRLSPVLDALRAEVAGRMTIGEVDVDSSPEVTVCLQVLSAPTLVMFRDGEPFDRRVGFSSAAALRSWVMEAVRQAGP
jgi:thioredoxin 1